MILDNRKSIAILNAVIVCLFVTGCTGITPFSTSNEPEKKAPVVLKKKLFVWSADGETRLRCARDGKGYYWQYLNANARFKTSSGKMIARLTDSGDIVTLSGTTFSLSQPQLIQRTNNRDLPEVYYDISTQTQEKNYQEVSRTVRSQTRGGVPLTDCAAGQLNHVLKVPFKATYTFGTRP